MSTVYFCQRPLHRTRQRETVDHCPSPIRATYPNDVRFVKEMNIQNKRLAGSGKLRQLAVSAVPLNARWVTDPGLKRADLVYTWGCIPLNLGRPYVVELDNPYVLAFYNLRYFAWLKPVLTRILRDERCRGIVCISEACRRTLRTELGDAVAQKACVVYPYIEDRTDWRPKGHGPVHFLYVSQEYYFKGAREVLHAFERLVRSGANAHLLMITKFPGDEVDRFKGAPWLTLMPANMDKRELHEKFFRRADVYVMPTFVESFGMVFLEALSFGLPIIASPTYAVPEMVVDGLNGLLIDAAFPFYLPDGRAAPDVWLPRCSKLQLDERIRKAAYPKVEEALFHALGELMDRARRDKMADASRSLFRSRFAEDVRSRAFVEALHL